MQVFFVFFFRIPQFSIVIFQDSIWMVKLNCSNQKHVQLIDIIALTQLNVFTKSLHFEF